MHTYKSKLFHKWALKEGLTDPSIIAAINEMDNGLVDADLGGNVYKKRAPIEGQRKSSGLRTILAFKIANRAFFMYGFAKNERSNIRPKELKALKAMAKELLSYDAKELTRAVKTGGLIEAK